MNQIIVPTGGASIVVPGLQAFQAVAEEPTPARLLQWLDGVNDGVSVHSACNDTNKDYLADAEISLQWSHLVDEEHWIIFDLGASYYIEKIRIYKNLGTTPYDWNACDVYCSHSPVNLGNVDAENLDFTSTGVGWKEATTEINAVGRYVKIAFGSYDTNDHVATGEVQFYV
jgi:hypothetical protein